MTLVTKEETKKKLDLMLDNIAKDKNVPIVNQLI